MKKTVLLVLLSLSSFCFGQIKTVVATSFSVTTNNADYFVGNDSFGFSYTIKNNVLAKDKTGEYFEYKNINLGKITSVDITNPLKIIVFYEVFNSAIMLDNQLNEIQTINLSDTDSAIVVAAIGISTQNKLWIYDSVSQQIGLFDYLKKTFKSLTPSIQGNLKYFYSDFVHFNWIDEQLHWYSCDVFGKITSKGAVNNFDQIQFISDTVAIFSKDYKLYVQDYASNSIYQIENVDNSFINFCYKNQILSIFTNQKIINYKIILP